MNRSQIVRRTASALLVSTTVLTGAGIAIAQAGSDASADDASGELAARFTMVRSTGAVNAGCLQGAGADVTVKKLGVTEKMTVKVHDLPPGTEYDLFVTQDSEAPFGVAWYQSDLRTDQSGNGTVSCPGSLQHRDVRRRDRFGRRSAHARGRTVPRRRGEPAVRADPHLPPRPLVQRPGRRRRRRLPVDRDAVQR